jgi:hypothetical protein
MKWIWLTVAVLVGLVAPSTALAAGGPVPAAQGSAVAIPGSTYSYAAFGAGRDTIVKRFEGGAVSALRVSGHYGVPGVGQDGSTTGLSGDGRTLVLADIPATYPPRTTRLLVLAAPRLAVRARLTLAGFSTVDAISPNGRWLYLIQYPSSDISKYAVRAYDLAARRLLPQPVVDPREPDEAMTGFPITRVMSAGQRWAYTLYFRPTGAPFVHALDTVHRRAVCVDLPSTLNTGIGNGQLRLTPGGGTLQVVIDGVTGAQIDTRTFAVTAGAGHKASARIRPVSGERPATPGSDGVPWELIVLGVAALGALAAVLTVPVQRKRSPTDHGGHRRKASAPGHPEHDATSAEPQPQPTPWTFSK